MNNPNLIRTKWRKAGLFKKKELELEPHDNTASLTIFSDYELSD